MENILSKYNVVRINSFMINNILDIHIINNEAEIFNQSCFHINMKGVLIQPSNSTYL